VSLALVGAGLEAPLVGGGTAPHLYLDYAASAPALVAVRDAVDEFLPYYGSVHRGVGLTSKVSTDVYEAARDSVARFVGARSDDVVVFTRNTTDAVNLLSSALPAGVRTVTFSTEHHANLLPWQRRNAVIIDTPHSPAEVVATLDQTLARLGRGPLLVAVTGASNVTGERWPIAEISAVAQAHGARTLLDAVGDRVPSRAISHRASSPLRTETETET